MRQRLGRFLVVFGLGAILLAVLLAVFNRKTPPPSPLAGPQAAFLGSYGYVIGLPPDYAALKESKDSRKTGERVHFFKVGTDPTSLLDEGLYGQLGIVRLEVAPSEFAANINGLSQLTQRVSARARQRGEKYTLKNLELPSLRGVQFSFDVPFPRVEAYILGQQVLYSFMAGQDDEIYRALITSLRETQSGI